MAPFPSKVTISLFFFSLPLSFYQLQVCHMRLHTGGSAKTFACSKSGMRFFWQEVFKKEREKRNYIICYCFSAAWERRACWAHRCQHHLGVNNKISPKQTTRKWNSNDGTIMELTCTAGLLSGDHFNLVKGSSLPLTRQMAKCKQKTDILVHSNM